MLPYVASVLGGTVTGMMVGDTLGAIPTKVSVPATGTGGAAKPKATANGQPVGSTTTARQHVFTSAGIVVGAMVVLIFGSRALRDARI